MCTPKHGIRLPDMVIDKINGTEAQNCIENNGEKNSKIKNQRQSTMYRNKKTNRYTRQKTVCTKAKMELGMACGKTERQKEDAKGDRVATQRKQ